MSVVYPNTPATDGFYDEGRGNCFPDEFKFYVDFVEAY